MGNLLGSPETAKDTHRGSTEDGIVFAVSSMQGWRVHMEDAHILEPKIYAKGDDNTKIELPGHAIFAVFDGHGGTFAALYAGNNLCRVLSRQDKFVEYAKFTQERPTKEETFASSSERAQYVQKGLNLLEDALCDAFVALDKEIALALRGTKVPEADAPYHEGDNEAMEGITATESQDQSLSDEGDSGTTACVVVMTPEWVICANAGDSRAVYSKSGNKAIPLSYDHKPEDDEEEKRIRAAGGYVAGGRVEGDLAVSRGLGDFRFKNVQMILDDFKATNGGKETHPGDQKVSPIPDIIVQNRNPEQDEFFVVACDGIWDVQTNYEAIKFVAELFNEGESDMGLVCEEMCDTCLELGSKDNMTSLVVKFPAQKIGEGGGVSARREKREAERLAQEKQAHEGP